MSEILARIDAPAGGDGARAQSPTAHRIEASAVVLFFERGYAATTMREIAQACGITAGALYNHFSAKEQLLSSIIQKVHDELERVLRRAIDAAGDDPADRLAAIARAHALFHTRYRKEARVANEEIASLPEADRIHVVAQRRLMRGWLEDALKVGTRAGRFTIADRGVATLSILSMGIRIAEWFSPDRRLSAEDVADLHADLVLRMVGAR